MTEEYESYIQFPRQRGSSLERRFDFDDIASRSGLLSGEVIVEQELFEDHPNARRIHLRAGEQTVAKIAVLIDADENGQGTEVRIYQTDDIDAVSDSLKS